MSLLESSQLLPSRRFKTLRTIMALILREMSTTYGKSPGGYIWAVVEPAAGVALLSVLFSLAFRAPPIGSSFSLFYATGLLPFMLYVDISRKIAGSLAFSKQLLFYPGVTFVDAVIARFVLNYITQILVVLVVAWGIIWMEDLQLILNVRAIILAVLMAGALGLGVGVMNCFLFRRFPIWVRVWAIMTRPLFLLSCIFVMYDHVPEPFSNYLWFNPLVQIVGQMRSGFTPPIAPITSSRSMSSAWPLRFLSSVWRC
ncbi:MAG: ABC transporter permease [Paracoccaceae bacterium]